MTSAELRERATGMRDDSYEPVEMPPGVSGPVRWHALPDGRPSLMLGDVPEDAGFNHLQGDNPEHFQNDCGLMSVQDVLRQFGAHVSEGDVVAHAVQYTECNVDAAEAALSGGTKPSQDARILTDYGVPSRVKSGQTMAELAADVEQGHGVILGVNSGVLWLVPENIGDGSVNHAVTVTGVALDPQNWTIQGFYINDSGSGKSAEFVGTVIMRVAWQDTGGWSVVTDAAHPEQANPRL